MSILDGRSLIDIHSHVLPGLDDGARTSDAALQMLKEAADDGIGTIVATPHSHYAAGPHLLDAVDMLQQQAADAGIEITVLPGHEVRIAADLVEQYERGDILTLNGTDYLLLEFFLSHNWKVEVLESVIRKLIDAGLKPILAHPERYPFVVLEPMIVKRFAEMGVPLQLNAPSLSGYHSEGSQRTAIALLEAGLVHIVASDAHTARYRPPQVREALERIEAIRGESYVEGLIANAEAVISGGTVQLDLGIA
ncbi:MAG: CpsB/CapC family capsule biosynthesis tyrosine phosphatase [Thermomicrobiales bacterium]